KLSIRLERLCVEVRCGAGQTCTAGRCMVTNLPPDDAGMDAAAPESDAAANADAANMTEPDSGTPSMCPKGYTGSDPATCKDIDECLTGVATCDARTQCVNRDGSYGCTDCPSGYAGDPKVACQNVDECTAGTDQCDSLHPCTDTAGGYLCG